MGILQRNEIQVEAAWNELGRMVGEAMTNVLSMVINETSNSALSIVIDVETVNFAQSLSAQVAP